jgi:hypothetical protein
MRRDSREVPACWNFIFFLKLAVPFFTNLAPRNQINDAYSLHLPVEES